jgi:1,4-alpha-glucan branching enzyme
MLNNNLIGFNRVLFLFFIAAVSFFTFNFINKSQPVTKSLEGREIVEWSKNAVIYEVNVRQFSKEGTFKAVEAQIPRLKELGVKILWLMPIQPIGEVNRKGTLGSYYSIKDYNAINPEFGTAEDFQSLVNTIHKNDMYVIIDWVANHTAWDHIWTKTNPDFYIKDTSGNFVPPVKDWHDVIDLNYDNKNLRNEMIKSLKYWVAKYNIDGFRCDVADMVPKDFWEEARLKLEEIRPVFMLAEAEKLELLEKAFDMCYSWTAHHLFNDIAKRNKTANDLRKYIYKDLEEYTKGEYRMLFTTNHDENSWNGSEYERLGKNKVNTFTALTFVLRGMPLIYNGQEAENTKRLSFFEKDSIAWKQTKTGELIQKLCSLKTNNKALWNGNYGGSLVVLPVNDKRNVLAVARVLEKNKVFAVFNLSNKTVHSWISSDVLDGEFTNFITGKKVTFNNVAALKLKPWQYYIFTKN